MKKRIITHTCYNDPISVMAKVSANRLYHQCLKKLGATALQRLSVAELATIAGMSIDSTYEAIDFLVAHHFAEFDGVHVTLTRPQ